AFIGREDTATFTAWHELGHRGINIQGRELWNDWLKEARRNDTVKQIADHTQQVYAKQGINLSDLQATEEAMVDIFAAYKTQQWDKLEHRHQLKIHDEFKKPLGTAARLWNSAKEKIGKIFNRQPEKVSDEQIFAMLGKLEQSIYQQPEMAVSQRLEMGEKFTSYFDLNTQPESDFAKAVDDIVKTGKAETIWLNLGTTPDSWQLVGLPNVSVDIHADNMVKAMSEYLDLPQQYYPNGKEKGTHNISPETLKQIPEQLNNPVAIFKSAPNSSNPNGYVVLTELIEADKHTGIEKPIIAALNLKQTKNSLEVLNITSIHGRWRNQIESAIERFDKESNAYVSDLKYWDKEKGHQLANSFELQLPSWLDLPDDLSSRNIKTNKDLMQYRKEKQMENNIKFDVLGQPENPAIAEQGDFLLPSERESRQPEEIAQLEKEMQKIEEVYYAKFPNAMHPEKFAELTKAQGIAEQDVKNTMENVFGEHFYGEQWDKRFGNSFVVEFPENLNWQDENAVKHNVIMPFDKVHTEISYTLSQDLVEDLSAAIDDYQESIRNNRQAETVAERLNTIQNSVEAFEQYRQKTADFFGISIADVQKHFEYKFVQYKDGDELLENAKQILSGRLNNPENQNPTVIASEQSERGNLTTTENHALNQEIATTATQSRNDGLNSSSLNNNRHIERSEISQKENGGLETHPTPTTAQSEVTALSSGFSLPENIQNTEFGRQAERIFQSTADNQHKIENTADERSKDILSKHHTYIEALKADFHYWVDIGDFYKASERLGDIRLNQQMFDERIGKTMNNEMQPEKPENNVKFDVLGQPETVKTYDWYQQQIKQVDEKINDAKFEAAKQPENQERQQALQKAIDQKTALELECQYGVSSPKLVDLYRKQQELNDKDFSQSVKLNEAFKAELKQLKQQLPNDFLSATDKKLMETAKEIITKPTSNNVDIQIKLDYLNNAKLVQDLGLNHKEIQTALTEALSHKDKNLRLMAVNHSQMQDKWLQKVIDKHRCPDTVKEAQKVLQNRQSLSGSLNDRNGGLETHPTQPTAQQGGFSLSVGSKKQAVKATKQASMDM
ncbi:MAG: hypothetical protein IJR44_04305, partial [Neisseriaceae bacterium]|nr:hypothetical protein [Neisseriaceae bacterium]